MPKNKKQDVVFTLLMAAVMVYGMICYNVALNIGGCRNEVFLAAFHEFPIMWPVAVLLELIFVGRLAQKLAFRLVDPRTAPPDRHHAGNLRDVSVADVPVHELLCLPVFQGRPAAKRVHLHLGADHRAQLPDGAAAAILCCRSAGAPDFPPHFPRLIQFIHHKSRTKTVRLLVLSHHSVMVVEKDRHSSCPGRSTRTPTLFSSAWSR